MVRLLRFGLLIAVTVLTWPSVAQAAVSLWGGGGTGQGQFSFIGDIAVDSAGNVYVSDLTFSGTVNRIQKFSNTGAFITEWDVPGREDGESSIARGLAADVTDRLYVVDTKILEPPAARVLRFDSSGTLQTSWSTTDVTSVAVSKTGDVYLAGGNINSMVHKFDADGTPLTSWGSRGTADGEFGWVRSDFAKPAVDAAGNVYVPDATDIFNALGRIQKFGADGAFIFKWPIAEQNQLPRSVAVGPDGMSLFVAATHDGRIEKYDGAGNLLGTFQLPSGVDRAQIAVDRQGTVFVTSSVTVFRIDPTVPTASLNVAPTLALTGESITLDASGSLVPFASITKFEWDLDGDGAFEFDTGTNGVLTHAFSSRGTFAPVVRVTAPSGKTATATGAAIEIRAAPPSGEIGLSINDGAVFTNDPIVMLKVVWPALAREARVSNDGGFVPTSVFPVNSSIPWTLQESGPERLPKTVYLRFDLTGSQTFADDIILDQTRPAVVGARVIRRSRVLAVASATKKRRYTLRLRARDNASGVAKMQLRLKKRSKPRKLRKYKSRFVVTVPKSKKAIRVRVQDGAGNLSRWRTVRLVRKR